MALTKFDHNLLKRCLAGESDAWREFVDRFAALFVQVIKHAAEARRMRLSPNDIDDFCAQILTSLLQNDCVLLRRFRGKSSLATYLTVVARRIVVRKMHTEWKAPRKAAREPGVRSPAPTRAPSSASARKLLPCR